MDTKLEDNLTTHINDGLSERMPSTPPGNILQQNNIISLDDMTIKLPETNATKELKKEDANAPGEGAQAISDNISRAVEEFNPDITSLSSISKEEADVNEIEIDLEFSTIKLDLTTSTTQQQKQQNYLKMLK